MFTKYKDRWSDRAHLISRQIRTNLHLNGFPEWVLLVLTAIVIQS